MMLLIYGSLFEFNGVPNLASFTIKLLEERYVYPSSFCID